MRVSVSQIVGAAFTVAICSCALSEQMTNANGTWVGAIKTEGDVTTVINEAGSIWGGTAQLVEEASIGVESGEDVYMFGQVVAVWAANDRIYVVDRQVPAVRVYDFDGRHIRDLGRRGQGPGEFVSPVDLVVADSGNVYVIESNMRMSIFAPDGTPRDTWAPQQSFEVGLGRILTLAPDGAVWVPYFDHETERLARIRYGPEGFTGKPSLQPELSVQQECLTYERNGARRRFCDIPFAPVAITVFTAKLSWLTGISSAYRFEVRARDGSTRVVERFWDPVLVSAAERARHRQRITETLREREPSWTWGDLELPAHKPAYLRLIPERNGRTWAMREMPSRESSDCPEGTTTCWRTEGYWFDAFNADGQYLGSAALETPRPAGADNLRVTPVFIDGDTVLAVLTDDLGTLRVKRYRLLLPGER